MTGFQDKLGLTMNPTTDGNQVMSEKNLWPDVEEETAYKAGIGIHKYYFPVIALIGLVSKTLALFILLQPKNRRYPCYRTLIALSFSDLVIIFSGLYNWIVLLLDDMNETHCKIWTYLFQTAALSSALMVVFVTIHKYSAFLSPFKSHKFRSPSRTVKIILCLVTFSFLYNIVTIFGTNTVDNKICVGITSTSDYDITLSWIALVFHVLLPVIFVTILNSLILRSLRLSNKFCKSSVRMRSHSGGWQGSNYIQSTSQNAETKQKNKKNVLSFISSDKTKNPLRHYDKPTATYHIQSSILLIAVTCVFALLTPPLYMCHIVYNFIDYKESSSSYATYVLVYYLCFDLYITNSCTNLFLYLGAGTKFREDLKKLFQFKTKKLDQSFASTHSFVSSVKQKNRNTVTVTKESTDPMQFTSINTGTPGTDV